MDFSTIKLDDKYELLSGRVYLTGVQALVRLPLIQKMRDEAAKLNTAGFISGYRGSPLGTLDQHLWQAEKFLKDKKIHFEPGLNEDLAATSVWGSQQNNLFDGAKYDGVFSLWYGKGPGVDRSMDVIKHANAAGTSPHGGVLLVGGDDHVCKSSTLPHHSEYAYMDAGVPVLHPANIQDILDYGIYGWAMSRYCGAWVALKIISDLADGSASVYVAPDRPQIKLPTDFDMPKGGLNIRWPDKPAEQESRLHNYKLQAAQAFARANQLDKIIWDSPKARLGIVATGKAYLDVLQALEDMGIDERQAAKFGLRLYKVAMPFPLEPEGAKKFAQGLDEILVVEEKRSVIEKQLKEYFYGQKNMPKIMGKKKDDGSWLLPSMLDLGPGMASRAIGGMILKHHKSEKISQHLAWLDTLEKKHSKVNNFFDRLPYYCSGCPHNTSTKVPEGSRAVAGIGCHYMVMWMDRNTDTFTQMGGEGVPWIGQSPFTDTKHVFANLGDGTYTHSGILAIRASVAAGVNITYKILYNDAVAMTGGQPAEGSLTVAQMAQQVYGEGVKEIRIVSDDPDKYPRNFGFPASATVHHRDELPRIQKELRDVQGTTVILYDQVCAAEKRRRRKRGLMEDPARRIFINESVCEGCGDCGVKSNCLSILPVETEYGRKRMIDQSSCNKDYSCVNGFCPSFVSVIGAEIRKAPISDAGKMPDVPHPGIPELGDQSHAIFVTGIGGTGVVTIGALLAMAAHLEGKGCSTLDMTGLAQKGGAVTSHIKIGKSPDHMKVAKIQAGGADVVLAGDMVVASGADALRKMMAGKTHVLLNAHETTTGAFTRNPDLQFPGLKLIDIIRDKVGGAAVDLLDATGLATSLLGDSIASNLFMIGYAWQKGWIPLTSESIMRAVELNGAAVDMNKKAFFWGRVAAHDPDRVQDLAAPKEIPASHQLSESLDEMITRRVADLTAYQNARYAQQYLDLVEKVRAVEAKKVKGKKDLSKAVARYYFKLMAYKDEYEVARLYTNGDFKKQLESQFTGSYKLKFHLAPPLLAKRNAEGQLQKMTFGSWVLGVFHVLARLKFLRGTPLDIFGYTAERKMERQLITDYEKRILRLLKNLNAKNYATAVAVASVPEHIRGYGHVKERHVENIENR